MGFTENRTYTKRRLTYTYSGGSSGGTWTVGQVSVGGIGSVRYRERCPNYATKISKGESATTYYKNTKTSSNMVKGHFLILGRPKTAPGAIYESDISPFIDINYNARYNNIPGSMIGYADQEAVVSVFRKARAVQVDYSGQTILGELRETVHMLRKPFVSLRTKALEFLSKNKPKRGRAGRITNVKAISDSWLEFSFGVQPLINDINEVISSMNSIRLDAVRRVRGIGSKDQTRQLGNFMNTGGYCQWYYDELIVNTITVLWVLGVKEKLTSSHQALGRAFENGGFTLAETPVAAWEIIPWSFLIDYFSNVGNVLEASAFSTRDIAWSSGTKTYHTIVDAVKVTPFFAGDQKYYYMASSSPFQAHAERHAIERNLGLPTLRPSAVRLEMPGLSKKWLNMAALVGSRNTFAK